MGNTIIRFDVSFLEILNEFTPDEISKSTTIEINTNDEMVRLFDDSEKGYVLVTERSFI